MTHELNDESRKIDVRKELCPSPHSLRNKVGRVVWGVVWWLFFRPSPRMFHGWRRFLLRVFGAAVGRRAKIDPTVRIWIPSNLVVGEEAAIGHHVDCYDVARVSIGAHATVSQYAFLCTASHDMADPHMGLTSAPIEIGPESWVCARVFVAPGVTIGRGAVAGACAVVTRPVDPWHVVAGNPARFIRRREVGS